MTDEERQRFARRLRERDLEIERLREEGTVELAKALLEIEQLRDLLAEKPEPDLRALLPELAVIRQVMKDTKP